MGLRRGCRIRADNAPDSFLLFARHSGGSRNPTLLCSFARHSREGGNPVLAVLFFRARASTRLRRAAYFLCSCKESRQRNTPQRLAPFGHPARKVRVIGRVPLIAHPVQQRNRRDPSRRPLRGLIVRCRRKAMGPREEPERARPARRSERQKRSSFAFAVALDPGPVSRGKGRPESPVRVARRDAREFANGQDAHRANPGLTLRTRSAQRGGRGSRGVFSLVTFSCTSKRK